MWMMMMYEKEVMIILPAFDFGFYFQRKAHFPVTGTLCFELPGGKQKYLSIAFQISYSRRKFEKRPVKYSKPYLSFNNFY